MKPKMRIQLLDEKLSVTSDRLVDQYTELLEGPKEKHNGPVRLEAVIKDEWSLNQIKKYLDGLKGLIPLDAPRQRGAKPTQATVNPYKEIYHEVKGKKYMEDVIEYLDKLNFRFVTSQFLKELAEDKLLPEKYKFFLEYPDYQYAVRVLRYAKNPANDKFDFSLIFGIRFFSKPSKLIYVYKDGELKVKFKREWKKSGQINLKEKKVPMVFPDYMTIEERKHWRYCNRKVELNKPISAKEEKFWNRYKTDIKNMNEGKPGHNL